MPDRDLTDAQRHLLAQLTDARCANLFQLADLIGDMNADGLEFLRRLGDPRYEALTSFLKQTKPETFTFLAEARDEEIKNLQAGLRIVVSLRIIGSILKWAVGGFVTMFISASLFWDKVSIWLKPR